LKGTRIKTFDEKSKLDEFLLNYDVLSVQYAHSIRDLEWGARHYHEGVWIVWYKLDSEESD
jgi:hypothetical protein